LIDLPRILPPANSPRLTAAESEQLIAAGVATGGMQAKLEAALLALHRGVEQVQIAPGAAAAVLDRVLAGDEIGTRLALAAEGVA